MNTHKRAGRHSHRLLCAIVCLIAALVATWHARPEWFNAIPPIFEREMPSDKKDPADLIAKLDARLETERRPHRAIAATHSTETSPTKQLSYAFPPLGASSPE